ncbi:aminodeoxychorismate synthase component I [Rhodococcus sp. HNM0563]|uniref:aminodeoxychorismate synthase component I n=1 Tax=unclassified Rhodococcus (in: high G+C Gram-positive bacteria) TaxID=192944 RepID=UPI00146BD3E6|nr:MULTISPECIES: aminodeoxychorismate synthase component I [unclassified Rhodococcus (in: high G+C Gram-positive bacteria)]MCK0089646.1 aminodeoxychorismate synthase component I [Rhodococcus sp. F64268]NLU62417.1 aminodeoxychorismate synthase component I [Rhodococcus sp. HNM0563]
MRMERIGRGGTPAQVLATFGEHARRLGTPAPAALTGSWFGAAAVIAPSLGAQPAAATDAFTCPDIQVRDSGPRIGGGWMGYLAYPDPVTSRPPALPVAAGGWTDTVLRLDHDGYWWYETLTDRECSDALARAVIADPADRTDTVGTAAVPEAQWNIDWSLPERDAHRHGVEQCLDAIRAGEVYQACVCTRFTGDYTGDPLSFFVDAITRTNPARAAYLEGSWGSVASLSPELFVSRHGRRLASSPIKGTLPLDRDPDHLRASVKDVAENIMIVDLVRNDLGRVAEPGSVAVPELLAVRPAPGVWHLVSTVTATARLGVSARDLLEATFPPASVTGCPKGRARELLQQWEPSSRGVYCGTVGMASPLAGTESNVAIRTVEFDADGTCALGVGGGITIDSDPDAEWQECLDKAASILALSTPCHAETAVRTAVGVP